MKIPYSIEVPDHLIEAHKILWIDKHKLTDELIIHFDGDKGDLQLDASNTQHFIPLYNEYCNLRKSIISIMFLDAEPKRDDRLDIEMHIWGTEEFAHNRKKMVQPYILAIREIDDVLEENEEGINELQGHSSSRHSGETPTGFHALEQIIDELNIKPRQGDWEEVG